MSYTDMPGEYDANVSPYLQRPLRTEQQVREARMQWQPIETAPAEVVVRTKIDEGGRARNEQLLKRHGKLWFLPNGSTYVYYTPTHWRPLAAPERTER